MFSLSTSWNSSRHTDGAGLVREIKSIGFDTIELGFALTRKVVDEILALKKSGGINISSLHNMCPLPEEIPPEKASPDYYSLASPRNVERALAIRAAKNTILYARSSGAKAVVLHAGRVEIKDRMRELAGLSGDEAKFRSLRKEMMEERKTKSPPYLDSVIKSLEELVPYAHALRVALALETRFYYREIPLLDEFEKIFENFTENELYYWHDAGHAEVFERLHLARHEDFLEKFSNRLIGVHLHDIIGLIKDHNVPGSGTFDFGILKPYIRKDTIKVIEAHEPATGDDIRRGVEYLRHIFC